MSSTVMEEYRPPVSAEDFVSRMFMSESDRRTGNMVVQCLYPV
jgi:hypothetical protein